jgi:hypothetical protein
MSRKLFEVCLEIRREWKPKVSPYALPYLQAMESLDNLKQNYICDSGVSCALYFLANAQSFKGEAAKRIKLELKAMVAEAQK